MLRSRYLPAALCLLAALAVPAAALCADKPHIVYITADDLGWKDVGYHGSTIRTPNLDRLAKEGARLEQFYVQPYASQTRAAALTGRYPMRYGLQTMQIQWFSEFGLPTDERTLAQALLEAGYRTVLLGAWQLGHAQKEYWPTQRGYQRFYGHLTGAIDYFKKVDAGGRRDWWRDEKRIEEDGYATTLLAREAARVVAKHDPTQPLFLHVSFVAPKPPYQGTKPFIDYYHTEKDQLKIYRAMVTAMDAALGEVIAAFDKRGMLSNTLIVFHANSGGAVRRKFSIGDGDTDINVASNGPYRGGRGGLHEGGVRAAALVWQPGVVAAGTVTELIHVVDLYSTLLARGGGIAEQAKLVDGVDVWPAIAAGKPSPRQEALLNVEEFRGALRSGDWKLIHFATLPTKTELYNLRADPSEEDNQAEREPERVRSMLRRLTDFAWEMAPAKYLEGLTKPRKVEAPMYWGENPVRP